MKFLPLELENRLLSSATEVANGLSLNVYDLEFNNNKLIIFVFNPQTLTATIDDCINFDREFTPILETLDIENITLEVSSPGINRKLTKKEHFIMHSNNKIVVKLKRKIDLFEKKRIIGTLRYLQDSLLIIEVDGTTFEISMNDIDTVRLD